MTKAISSYPKSERKQVIARRLRGNTRGLGYWAAVDAEKHLKAEQGNKAIAEENEEEE